jgi:predicted transcriptional regulator
MTRTLSRPLAGAMSETIYARVTDEEKQLIAQLALEQERTISWIVRKALIDQGIIPVGR